MTNLWMMATAVCLLAGVGLLFISWRHRSSTYWWRRLGWMLLVLQIPCWAAWLGWEFGSVMALSVPGIAALLLILLTPVQRRNDRKPKKRREKAVDAPPGHRWREHVLLVLLTLPFAALTSGVISTALVQLMPWSALGRIALLVFLAPFLWGMAAAWLSADDRRLRPVLVLTVLSVLALPLIWSSGL